MHQPPRITTSSLQETKARRPRPADRRPLAPLPIADEDDPELVMIERAILAGLLTP